MLKVILLSIVILALGLLALSFKLIIDKKAVFKGSSCSASSDELRDKGVGDCCGGSCSLDNEAS